MTYQYRVHNYQNYYKFDISSFIDLFPYLHEQFKEKITSLMNCYLINHHVTVKLLDQCAFLYILLERYREYKEQENSVPA